MGIYNRFIKFARELQKALQENPNSKIEALMREPIVLRIMGLPVMIGMGKYRIFYYLDFERRVVIISGIEHRKKPIGEANLLPLDSSPILRQYKTCPYPLKPNYSF